MSLITRKIDFRLCGNKGADQLHSEQRLCFRYMDSTIPVSNHLQCLYSSVYVGPDRKPQKPVFLCCGSYKTLVLSSTFKEMVLTLIFQILHDITI